MFVQEDLGRSTSWNFAHCEMGGFHALPSDCARDGLANTALRLMVLGNNNAHLRLPSILEDCVTIKSRLILTRVRWSLANTSVARA